MTPRKAAHTRGPSTAGAGNGAREWRRAMDLLSHSFYLRPDGSFPLAHSSRRDDGALPRGSASHLAYLTGALARGSCRRGETLDGSDPCLRRKQHVCVCPFFVRTASVRRPQRWCWCWCWWRARFIPVLGCDGEAEVAGLSSACERGMLGEAGTMCFVIWCFYATTGYVAV